MTEQKEQFDDDLGLKVPTKLAADLNALFEPSRPVPPDVDRAVIDRACRHLVRRESARRRRRVLRWAGTAAAAAVIIFAFVLDFTMNSPSNISRLNHPAAQADIDHSGRVDILDALKLARHIESADPAETSLSLRKQGWDINGDGAVRLDKGVL